MAITKHFYEMGSAPRQAIKHYQAKLHDYITHKDFPFNKSQLHDLQALSENLDDYGILTRIEPTPLGLSVVYEIAVPEGQPNPTIAKISINTVLCRACDYGTAVPGHKQDLCSSCDRAAVTPLPPHDKLSACYVPDHEARNSLNSSYYQGGFIQSKAQPAVELCRYCHAPVNLSQPKGSNCPFHSMESK